MAYFGWFVLLPALWGVAVFSLYAVLRDEGLLRATWRRPRLRSGPREIGRRRRECRSRQWW